MRNLSPLAPQFSLEKKRRLNPHFANDESPSAVIRKIIFTQPIYQENSNEIMGFSGRAYATEGFSGRAYATTGLFGRAKATTGLFGRAYATTGFSGRAKPIF